MVCIGDGLLKDVSIWLTGALPNDTPPSGNRLGEPDPFGLKRSAALQQIVSEVIRGRMDGEGATGHIAAWAEQNIAPDERERFRETAEAELLDLHEGNFARYEGVFTLRAVLRR
jgi:hypothetical protein